MFLRGGAWHSHSCGQTVGWIKMPLGKEVGLGPGRIVLDGDPVGTGDPADHSSPSPLSAHAYCGQKVAHLSNCWALVSYNRYKIKQLLLLSLYGRYSDKLATFLCRPPDNVSSTRTSLKALNWAQSRSVGTNRDYTRTVGVRAYQSYSGFFSRRESNHNRGRVTGLLN